MSHHPHPEPDCELLADALGPVDTGPQIPPPPPPVRAARWLAAGDGLFTRADTLIERSMPRALNPLAQLGPAANAMLLLATVSGVLLLIWYSPSVQFAWHSLADLGPNSLGGIIRSVHRYSSDLVMLLILMHALRVLVGRKFADARWLPWVSGIGLLGHIWFIGWTGYWLVWDERAQLVALDSMKVLDVLPIFGEPMRGLFNADHTVPSLLFFVVFFLHMVLPLGIAGGLCFHLARLSRSKLLPDWRLSVWLLGGVLVAALIYPAVNAAGAQMAVKPDRFGMDWWYLWPLAISARLSGGGVWLAASLSMVGLMTVPWWLARRRPRPSFQAAVNISRCFACTQCAQDCPFGAITMVSRTDGKPFPSQAQIDADRCIGCGVCAGSCDTQGIGLAWFDAQRMTRELEQFVLAEVVRGAPPALAFVCVQSTGGWELFDEVAWQKRLPGYHVRPVPCAGWIEPKVIERVISKGAVAVLIVSCGSSEPFCREGDIWLPARLEGTREPAFRPNRADPRKVARVKFDLLRPALVTASGAALLDGIRPAVEARSRIRGWLAGIILTVLTGAWLLMVSDAPFRNPVPADPEFVFTFRASGDWVDGTKETTAAQDDRPIHMRGTMPVHRERSSVLVGIEVDGQRTQHVYAPKGIKSDGTSVGEVRLPLQPGPHQVTVTLTTGPTAQSVHVWSGEIEGRHRRYHVLSYDATGGFQMEP